jgi:hypothetical protein
MTSVMKAVKLYCGWKVNLPLHAMKSCGGVGLPSFLTLSLRGD